MLIVCFRGGCLIGLLYVGAKLHGFLLYLMCCVVIGDGYMVFGYDGKQVCDNIYFNDVVFVFEAFYCALWVGAVYNFGGGCESNCLMCEVIAVCEWILGNKFNWMFLDEARMGDYCWWILDLLVFKCDYLEFKLEYDFETMLREIHDVNVECWMVVMW